MEIDDNDSADAPASKRPKSSDVWKHFQLNTDKKYAKCLKCQKSYKTSGNMSNLIDHLKRAHPFIAEPKKPASTIRHFFPKNVTYDTNSTRKVELDSALARMIAIDVQPFRIVEDQGFRDFVHRLDPRYDLPSRNTIQKVHLQKIYDDVKTKLQASLNQVESCAITTDCWSSKANESYLTVTCHFIDGGFKLRSAVLTTSKLVNEMNHSSENISTSLHECLQKWNIFQKVNCVVTDNAASMIKACEILQKRNLPCFAHSINLVVQDALSTEKVKALLTKCKRIVAYFKSSTIAYAQLKKEQGDEKQYSLIQEVPTRWNSAFAMVQRILLIKEAVFAVLLRTPKAPLVLTAEEIEQLQDICLLLEPFNTNTSILSGNQYVTISHVIPIAWGLHSTMMKLHSKLQTAVGLETCLYLSDKIKQRLFPYESRSAARLATLLDPRFKKEGFRSAQNATQASRLLENELVEINKIAASTPSDNREEPSTSRHIKIPDIYEFLTEKLSCKTKSNRADAIITLREYTEKPNEPLDIDPLEYWKKRFPADNFAEWNNGHPLGLRTVHAYVLVYDMGNLNTFQFCRSMREQILDSFSHRDFSIIVVGNKYDTVTEAQCNSQELKDISTLVRKHWRCGYVECSARYNFKIGDVFRELMGCTATGGIVGTEYSQSNRHKGRCTIL